MKTWVKELIKSMDAEPDRWRPAFYTWKRDDGIEIWIASGVFLISLYSPCKIACPFWSRFRLWEAYKRCLERQAEMAIKANKK